jgi:crotonobetainyl-CoA hydratase
VRYSALFMGTEPALFEREGRVAIITFNRPEVRNAVDATLATAVGNFLEDADADRDVRAIVLTGSGVAFCAGADLRAASEGRKPFADGHREWGFAGIVQHPVNTPLIAAVNGFALGGGTEIALACDLVVASERATFGLPEVKRGILAGAGGLVRLPRQLPLKVAMHLALTGAAITAAEAKSWGLVNDVVGHDDVRAAAIALGNRIAENAPLAVQASKRVLLRLADGEHTDEVAAWALSDRERDVISLTADAQEGKRAFVEKREPQWTGS